jgi:hypothetical protein
MAVMGGVHKQSGFLLAFDGVTVPLGWPKLLPHLSLGRQVQVEVGKMAKPGNILVGRLEVFLFGCDDLPILLQRNVALGPFPRSLEKVEREDKALRLV